MRKSLVRKRIALALLSLAPLTAGCACGARPGQEQPDRTAANTMAAPTADAASKDAGQGVLGVDPLDSRPVTDDPRLREVRLSMEAGNPSAAVLSLRKALDQHRPSGVIRARWLYVLATLYEQTNDAAGAAVVWDEATQQKDWILADYAQFRAAKAYASLGKDETALGRVAGVGDGLAISERARLLRGDLLDATGASDDAVEIWRSHLSGGKRGTRWAEIAVRLAEKLIDGAANAGRARDALTLARDVLVHAPTSSPAAKAAKIEKKALTLLPADERAKAAVLPLSQQLLRARALFDAGRSSDALALTDDILKNVPTNEKTSLLSCETAYLHARVLERNRKKRPQAADAFGAAIERCKPHKDTLVSALYRGAKLSSRVRRTTQALARYGRVEREFKRHRLADDARLRSARLVLGRGDEAKFEQMLSAMPDDYPDGDMVEDGLFELAFHRIQKGKWKLARKPLERSVRERPKEKKYWVAGRARYYLARIDARSGRTEEADAALRDVILDHPFSYYAVLAYSRLAAGSEPGALEVFKLAEQRAETGPLVQGLPPELNHVAFRRAVELLRVGESTRAREEVRSLKLTSKNNDALWTAALVYARAGATHLAFRVARGRADWPAHFPSGRWRAAWELAYPRAFPTTVERETKASNISFALAYGIMREESAFDPNAVSVADAYGLMQLIMPTARMVAAKLKMKVDASALRRPEVNIRLGCKLLGDLERMFATAPLLAIPSYNAGAGATKRWLKNRADKTFDLWVEDIPYEETRGYTKRVISSIAVYRHLYAAQGGGMLQVPLQLRP